jgi:hypothetical protein
MNNKPEWDDPLFEMGRQHVIGSLRNIFERRLKFIESVVGQPGITYSAEHLQGQILIYKQILESLKREDNWQRDRHLIANGK